MCTESVTAARTRASPPTLSGRLSKLTEEVASVNPAARVECCSYGKVPLHSVLDVEAPRTDIQGVSHEVRPERCYLGRGRHFQCFGSLNTLVLYG